MLMDKELHTVSTLVINVYLELWKERERGKEKMDGKGGGREGGREELQALRGKKKANIKLILM